MSAVFGILCLMAFVWAAIRNYVVGRALVDSYPPQFKDGLAEKFILHEIALSPSTALPLQADYVKSMAVGCVATLFFSLSLFSAHEVFGSWLAFGGCLLIAYSTIKSWKTHHQNCNRAAARNDEE